ADGVLVDGERVRRLLFDLRAVCDVAAEGPQIGRCGGCDTNLTVQSFGLRWHGILGVACRLDRPSVVNHHPGRHWLPRGAGVSAHERCELDHRWVRRSGLLRRGDLWPKPQLSY